MKAQVANLIEDHEALFEAAFKDWIEVQKTKLVCIRNKNLKQEDIQRFFDEQVQKFAADEPGTLEAVEGTTVLERETIYLELAK